MPEDIQVDVSINSSLITAGVSVDTSPVSASVSLTGIIAGVTTIPIQASVEVDQSTVQANVAVDESTIQVTVGDVQVIDVPDGDKGSVSVSGGTWTINTGAVSNSMLAGSIALAKLVTDPIARANHTGTQAHTTITGLGTLATQSGTFSTQLDSLSGLSYTGNSLKVVRVNAGETGFELAAGGAGGATDLTYTASTRVLASSTGTDATLPLADGTNPGLMASTDFTKLSGIASGATVGATWGTNLSNIPAAVTSLSGTNTGDNAVNSLYSGLVSNATHTGEVTGATALTIAAGAVTLAKMADVATGSVFYRKTAGTGTPEVQTLATLKTDLGLTGTNSGDQTTIAGITGTKAQFDTAVTDGNFLYVGDVTTNATHTGEVTGATALTIANDAVTYAKIQNVSAASKLLGRGSAAGSGDVEEISIGSGLSLSGTTLSASGGGGSDPWTYVKVTSDFTTSSGTAVNVITDAGSTVLGFTPDANTQYEFEALLYTSTPTTATVGVRPGLAWPTGMTDGVAELENPTSATAVSRVFGNINASLLAAVGGLPNTTRSYPARIRGAVIAGASPSGLVRVQCASETAATNVTIKVGSFLRYRTI